MKRVIIVGAGFGGLEAAKKLARTGKSLQVTLIDRRNYHLFQPLLYQVATAGLSPADIAAPIRSILSRSPNTRVLLGNVSGVDLKAREVQADFGKLAYDYLILACGAKHSYFSHPEWEALAPGLKTLEQATEIRRRILLAFELAEKEPLPEKQKSLLTFLIVGGGPTGVELAGAIAEISRQTLSKDFRQIDPSRTRVILIESGPRILSQFSEGLSKKATRDLEKIGVQVWTRSRVTEVRENGVRSGEEFVEARTVIWAAGVQPSSLAKTLGVALDPSGRVIVQSDLSLSADRTVFVLGDMACVYDSHQKALPGLAPVAIQEGRHAAQTILRDIAGKARTAFAYQDKGQMATIGRKKAVVEMRGLAFHGFFAWLVWLVIHIYYLIGFRNKLFVFLQWTWSYMTFKKGARLIVDKEWRSIPALKKQE